MDELIDSLDNLGREYPEMENEVIPVKNKAKKAEAQGEGKLTLDVFEKEGEIVVKSTIAGISPDDIDISITNDMVTIKGQRYMDEEVKEKDYYYQELYWGSFSRSIILPAEVDADRATAVYKNGLLTIRMPKLEKNNSKKIKISSY